MSMISWFIPAHAGNTGRLHRRIKNLWVHPRSRGEYRATGDKCKTTMGFIPAHAGNTSFLLSPRIAAKVHPRSRGEYHDALPGLLPAVGSSPLTRGIPLLKVLRTWRNRFIPAHAGNTLKKALFYLTFSNTHFHISFNF